MRSHQYHPHHNHKTTTTTTTTNNLQLSLVPTPPVIGNLSTIEWLIDVARFFIFPKSSSSTSQVNVKLLKPLPKSKVKRVRGTWVCSESNAILRIVTDPPNPETILTVQLQGKIIEEHFTCNLHFSWPQVACMDQCPTRGSRVIFASYRDCDNEIQKFALRFASFHDAQSFIDVIRMKRAPLSSCDAQSFAEPIPLAIDHQHICKNANAYSHPNGEPGLDLELSSHSDFGSSSVVQYRRDPANIMDLVEEYNPQIIQLESYNIEQRKRSQNSVPDEISHRGKLRTASLFKSNDSKQNNCSQSTLPEGLPPSFSSLLTSCCTEPEKETAGLNLFDEINLKTQIIKYMSDSSFHDMLAKVEEVMFEIGGDLALC